MPRDTTPTAFYVAGRGLPRVHRRFLMFALPIAATGITIGAAGLALRQPPWGDGFWQTGAASEWTGVLRLEPYPMLIATAPGGTPDAYLLVEMGKFGARDRFRDSPAHDGAAVTVRGRELRRDGRRMIEIDPEHPSLPPAVQPAGTTAPTPRLPRPDAFEPVTLRGEIVDSKCDLGGMKPGSGRGHKACAILCIEGGIPPVLVTRDAGGRSDYYLLTDAAGRAWSDTDLDRAGALIAEPVVLSGRAGRLASWRVLRVDSLAPAGRGVPSPAP
jgi:hypothetical protein